ADSFGLVLEGISCYHPGPRGHRGGRWPAGPWRPPARSRRPTQENGAMTNRRRWMRRALIGGSIGLGVQQLWRHGHDYLFTEQSFVVEPGRIYRGAWQKPWPMRRIVRNHGIKTVLALAHPPEHRLAIAERDLARELGLRWIHIPIVDHRRTKDQAAEEAISDLLEAAAAVVADPANHPIFFHCHHGINRASMVQIAYRTKHCGWTLEEAAAEVARTVGLVTVNNGPDYRHMVSFYQSRVLSRRAGSSRPSSSAGPD